MTGKFKSENHERHKTQHQQQKNCFYFKISVYFSFRIKAQTDGNRSVFTRLTVIKEQLTDSVKMTLDYGQVIKGLVNTEQNVYVKGG